MRLPLETGKIIRQVFELTAPYFVRVQIVADIFPVGIVTYATEYIDTLPAAVLQGDVFALTITLIAFFIAVVIINKLTGMLVVFLKKAILFMIVTLAFWQFITMFFFRVTTEGLTDDTIIFGSAGFIIGFIALSISLFVAFRSFVEAREGPVTVIPVTDGTVVITSTVPGTIPAPAAPETTAIAPAPQIPAEVSMPGTSGTVEVPAAEGGGTFSAVKETLSVSNLKNDRSLGAVLAYLIIAQFGVFSSKTIPAPTFQVGLTFFALFLVAGIFFIHFTYNNYLTGLRHLVLAVIVGTIVSLILGYFWAGIPSETLFSPAFFQTDALVALVTGLALSLFMGGKG
jgi:hypothetical protein